MNSSVATTHYLFPPLLLYKDVLGHVLSYLSDKDLAIRFSLICKACLQTANQEEVWKKRWICQLNSDKEKLFFDAFNCWKIAYINFKQMSKAGTVVSPSEVISSEGARLIGKFEKGIFMHGKKICPNGTVIKGPFQTDGTLNGKGKVICSNGDVKKGEFKNGLLHGKGAVICFNGDVKKGEFRIGMLHGEGEIILANGISHKGQFKYDQLSSEEMKSFPERNIKAGRFKNGKLKHIQSKQPHQSNKIRNVWCRTNKQTRH